MKPSKKAPSADSHYGRAKGARGKVVTLLDPYTMNLLRRHGVINAEALQTMAEGIGSGLVKGTRILFIVSIVCQAAVGIALIDYVAQVLTNKIPLSVLAQKIGIFIPALTGPMLFWLGARRNRLKRTVSVMLMHRRCPHCGYDLRLLPVDAGDQATVCPECGCAWNLPGAAERAEP